MDLDKLKKEWNQSIIPPLSQEYILNITRKKGRSALDKLLLIEGIGLVSLPIVALLLYYFSNRLSVLTSPLFWGIYNTCCICAIVWQIYKILLLRKIDLSGSDMISCIKKISQYKICIVREFFVGFGFFLVCIASFGYSLHLNKEGNDKGSNFIFQTIIFIIITVIVAIVMYKLLYFRQIKKIQSVLSEIESLETE